MRQKCPLIRDSGVACVDDDRQGGGKKPVLAGEESHQIFGFFAQRSEIVEQFLTTSIYVV